MRIIGLDPGSTATGYGVVERRGRQIGHVAHGVVRPPRQADLPSRLAHIQRRLADLLAEHAPDRAVVEQVFVAVNPRSALVLGQARGMLLAGLGAAGIPVSELAAREVKQAVVGTGAASKQQVQAMVTRLLGLAAPPPLDAADALAIALAQASFGPLAGLGSGAGRRRASRRTLRAVAEGWARSVPEVDGR